MSLLEDQDIDIALLQETWLNKGDSAVLAEIKDHGFDVIHANRTMRDIGGGVTVIFKPEMNLKRSQRKESHKSFEVNITILKGRNTNIKIVNLYRTPYTKKHRVTPKTFLKEFENLLETLALYSGQLLIVGDFNMHIEKPDDIYAQQLISSLDECNLTQHQDKPTHIHGGILDLLITSENMKPNNTTVHYDNLDSDHYPVLFQIEGQKNIDRAPNITFQRRKYSELDVDKFKMEISKSILNDSDYIKNLNTDDLVATYKSTLTKLIDNHCPVQTKRCRKRPHSQWYTAELRDLKRTKRAAERKYRKSKDSIDWNAFCKIRNIYSWQQKETRSKYYKKHIENCDNMKNMYKVINQLAGNEDLAILPSLKDDQKTADDFSHFFNDKIEKLRSDIKKEQNMDNNSYYQDIIENNECDKISTFTILNCQEVKDIIESMNSKSCDLDPIPSWLVKKCLPELLPVLTAIINTSLCNANFPSKLKHANVRPTIKDKSGDTDALNNYRPISNTAFLAKVLEKAALNQINAHIKANDLHAKNQSGYRKGHSCETALLKIVNDIVGMTKNQGNAILILLDLSAAFDTIDHKILTEKLIKEFGITGNVLDWISSYLESRTFSVSIRNSTSIIQNLLYGVPQGSLLGPLLFILYVKYLESIATKYGLKIHIYADDTQLYIKIDPHSAQITKECIEKCLEEIRKWMFSNYLKINTTKTKMIQITTKKDNSLHFEVYYDNTKVENSSKVETLGVQLDANLTMASFIAEKCKSCYYHLRNLGRIKKSLSTKIRIQLVHNLVLSKLDYCNSLLALVPDYLIKKLQKVQNSAVRLIYDLKRRCHVTQYLKEAHFLPVSKRIDFKLCLFMYKISTGVAPSYLCNSFSRFEATRDLRVGRDILSFQYFNINKNDIFTVMVQLWNKLPFDIKNSRNDTYFKSKLKTLYFQEAFG